ncbi:hypothetical protein NA57DRAFT_51678 [Rhizodiscina lignyota]|uniref:Pre-mRNA-splicing factor 38B n=1 Tax=Rhizodiscina lignyota TaxID=1504668 RepID=A0A9P4IS76_9PEZI|nr:hypothetical protein NA57DRAFT_51678 [Rhizodiscina lignyota]
MADDLSDDYVASLLKKDAKAKSKDYSFVGLSAFLPKRPTSHAPKPNLKFLRNILKDTDSHNTALKEKEQSDSRARLRELRKENSGENRRGDERRRDKREEDRPSKRRRQEESDSEDGRERRHRRRREEVRSEHRHRDDRHRDDRHSKRMKREDYDSGDEDNERRRQKISHVRPIRPVMRTHREPSFSEDDYPNTTNPRRPRKRHRSTSRSRSPLPSSKHSHRKEHRRRRSPSHERKEDKKKSESARNQSHGERSSATLGADQGSDSDPLEAIVGPLPPRAYPQPRRRGRGAGTSSSAMDARFAASYDPSADVQPDSDHEQDDWDLALERLRDQAQWKAQGAERLRAAGFSEAEVKKWEKGGKGKEMEDEDVTWAKKGEGREWDRGKVVDGETGETELRAEWAKNGEGREWDRGKIVDGESEETELRADWVKSR